MRPRASGPGGWSQSNLCDLGANLLHVLCPLPTAESEAAAAALARRGGGVSQPVGRLADVAPALTPRALLTDACWYRIERLGRVPITQPGYDEKTSSRSRG